jgi:hypothetical protein
MASVSLLDLVRDLWGKGFRISRWYIPGHDGIDLPAAAGTPVRAVSSGKVSFAKDARLLSMKEAGKGWAIGGGNVVNIDVGNSLTAQYAHLQTINVREGQYVKAGDIIGTVGRTGGMNSDGTQGGAGSLFSSGDHLHFGLWDRKKNKMIDPTTWLMAQRAGWGNNASPIRDVWDGGGAMGGWGVPEGTILTKEIVDEIIARMDAAGLFKIDGVSNPISEAMAIDTTRKLLYAQIGKPWQPSTTDGLQQQINDAAKEADALGSLAVSVGGAIERLSDPANWVRILALAGGAVAFGIGTYSVLKATGTPSYA